MASNKVILCGPCQEGKVNTKADIWCYNCDEGLCSTCSGQHKRSKGTCDHKTIDVKSYKPSIGAIKTECDKHGRQPNLYCMYHAMPCCDRCYITMHSKCRDIRDLASVVEKTKIEKLKKEVDKNISSTLPMLNKIMNIKSGNIKRGEQQVDSIKKTIVKYRKKINKHLDDLEKKLCQETEKLWDQQKSEASGFITEVDEKQKNLKKMQEHLHTVISHTSKLQSFLGLHQIEQQVHQCQRYVDDLEDDDRAKEFEIKMNKNEEIEKMQRNLRSSKSLGEVTVVKTDIDWKKAQVASQEQSNINNMTMNIETKIKGDTSDMICLKDGRVIIVEERGKVNLLTSDGKLEKQLPISENASKVTQISQNTIAITYTGEKDINIFNMENETVTKVITLDKVCYGLSFSNNSLAVGLENDEIRIIDLEGKTLKSIQVESASNLCHLVYYNDRVIYSDYNGEAVYCYNGSGKQMWQYTQDLTGPWGLCTDKYGNIILADCHSDRIIVISKDGQNSKVLNGKKDGLADPQFICLNHKDSSSFICDYEGRYLAKFNLS